MRHRHQAYAVKDKLIRCINNHPSKKFGRFWWGCGPDSTRGGTQLNVRWCSIFIDVPSKLNRFSISNASCFQSVGELLPTKEVNDRDNVLAKLIRELTTSIGHRCWDTKETAVRIVPVTRGCQMTKVVEESKTNRQGTVSVNYISMKSALAIYSIRESQRSSSPKRFFSMETTHSQIKHNRKCGWSSAMHWKVPYNSNKEKRGLQ